VVGEGAFVGFKFFLFFLEFFQKKKEEVGLFKKKSITESFLEEGEGLARPEVVCKIFLREGGVCSIFLEMWMDGFLAGWLDRRLNKSLQCRRR